MKIASEIIQKVRDLGASYLFSMLLKEMLMASPTLFCHPDSHRPDL